MAELSQCTDWSKNCRKNTNVAHKSTSHGVPCNARSIYFWNGITTVVGGAVVSRRAVVPRLPLRRQIVGAFVGGAVAASQCPRSPWPVMITSP